MQHFHLEKLMFSWKPQPLPTKRNMNWKSKTKPIRTKPDENEGGRILTIIGNANWKRSWFPNIHRVITESGSKLTQNQKKRNPKIRKKKKKRTVGSCVAIAITVVVWGRGVANPNPVARQPCSQTAHVDCGKCKTIKFGPNRHRHHHWLASMPPLPPLFSFLRAFQFRPGEQHPGT